LTLEELLDFAHPAIIHFPIVGFIIGSLTAMMALGLLLFHKIFLDRSFYEGYRDQVNGYIEALEMISWTNILIGELIFPFTVVTGILDANGVENAIRQDLLAYKIRISLIIYFVMISPIFMKLYASSIRESKIFGSSIAVSCLYTLPILVSSFLTLLVASAGGKYTFGKSIFDNIGLEFLIPETVNKPEVKDPITYLEEISIGNGFLIVTMLLLIILILAPLFIFSKNNLPNLNKGE
jgi:uncharacterized membrane protein